MDDKLTSKEQSKLTEYEDTIKHLMDAFYATGMALQKIRDERLYRTTHATFDEYCKERWDFSSHRARQLIDAAGVIENLVTIVTKPATESQARELARLDPDAQRKVWEKVIETAPDGLITAAYIRETRESLIGPRNEPVQETLFDLDDYRKAIKHHVDAANYHIRRANHYRNRAFKQYGVQIELPFDFAGLSKDEEFTEWPKEIDS